MAEIADNDYEMYKREINCLKDAIQDYQKLKKKITI